MMGYALAMPDQIDLKPAEYREKGRLKLRSRVPPKWWNLGIVVVAVWTGAILAFAAEITVALGVPPGWVLIVGLGVPYAMWIYVALFTD